MHLPLSQQMAPVCRALVVAGGAFAALLLAAGCSRQPSAPESPPPKTAAAPAPAAPGACPFAGDVKPVVLLDLLDALKEKVGTDRWFVVEDPEHGDEIVSRLRGSGLQVTNRIVVALQDGAVVTQETRAPAVMVSVEIGDWTKDEVQATGVWYAAMNQEGRTAYRVLWQAPRWVAVPEGP